LGHLWLWLDHKILNVALLRLRFCSIAATKSNPNLSAILPTLFVDRPLLQAGNDISVIKDWMGHADLNTTHGYVEIDMKMKRKVLEGCQPPKAKTPTKGQPKWLKPGILKWLDDLS
jgi:hypothetical protein